MVIPVLLVALLGILVGGLINMLADDLPARQPVRAPHYPDAAPRAPSAWLGLTAFLLGRRASPGGARLSWRHPLTEVATASLMVTAYVTGISDPAMDALQLAFWLFYMAVFVLITVIDLEHRLILFVVIIPSCALALLDALTTAYGATLSEALIGALLGFGVFFLLYLGGFLFTRLMSAVQGTPINEVAFGYGDVILITLSGLILGWRPLILAMFITVFLGAFGAVLYLIARRLLSRQNYQWFTPLPYGQYIIVATVIMLLFVNEIAGAVVSVR